MKKILVIFLVTIFMCVNTSMGQLLKIPNLIAHYNTHNNEMTSDSISFIDYIISHYSTNSENNSDHQDLPFKTIDNSGNLLFAFSMVTSYQLQVVKPLISNKKIFFYNNFFKSKLVTSIWLPPKLF